MKHSHHRACRGFTLVEMAMVLMIVGLLLGGLIPTLTTQMESQRISGTRRSLEEIQQALIGFAIINGRLPCPAEPATTTGQAGAGIERTPPCTSSNSIGVLPWATLGVNETDAWGNRYTYRVSSDFADAVGSTTYGGCTPVPTPTQASFAVCSTGNVNVRSAATGGTSIAIDVPAVVISHGRNGYGAHTRQGTQLGAGSDADEQENSDDDTSYVSHTPTPGFDDEVMWLSGSILLNRMVTAGRLP